MFFYQNELDVSKPWSQENQVHFDHKMVRKVACNHMN